MASIHAHATGADFPTNIDTKDITSHVIIHQIAEKNSGTVFYTIPVSVPYIDETEHYSSWHSKFDINMYEARKRVTKIIAEELKSYREMKMIKQEITQIRKETLIRLFEL